MAPFTMATLPLQSCRMGCSLGEGFLRRRQPEHNDGAGLGTAVETDSAAGAAVAGVMRRVNAICVQFRQEFEAFGRAGLDAESAAFALFDANQDIAPRFACHIHLAAAITDGRCNHLVCSQYL